MKIQLSEHFTYNKLLRFVFPSIVMMIFTSIYSVVDGLFVSNFAGKTALASINLVFPVLMGLSALGFMIGTGGSAIVAKTLGEGEKEKANEYFSMLVYVTAIGGILLSMLGALMIPEIARILGAKGELLDNCILYARISCIYAAECIPELLCDSRKTKTWTFCHRRCRCNKHCSGFHFCRCTRSWYNRCCCCDRMWRIHWRTFPDPVFYETEFKPAAPWKDTF